MATAHRTDVIQELDYVELVRPVAEVPIGARGTVLSANPETGSFTVEFHDSDGETLEVAPCERLDLALVKAARAAARSANGRPQK